MAEELPTPKNESPCRGGFKPRPYAWTFTLKPAATMFSRHKRQDHPYTSAVFSLISWPASPRIIIYDA